MQFSWTFSDGEWKPVMRWAVFTTLHCAYQSETEQLPYHTEMQVVGTLSTVQCGRNFWGDISNFSPQIQITNLISKVTNVFFNCLGLDTDQTDCVLLKKKNNSIVLYQTPSPFQRIKEKDCSATSTFSKLIQFSWCISLTLGLFHSLCWTGLGVYL